MEVIAEPRPVLADYVEFEKLLPLVQDTFATAESVRWFVRCHRATLIHAEALIYVGGRLRYHPERFQEAVVPIGRAQAERMLGQAKPAGRS